MLWLRIMLLGEVETNFGSDKFNEFTNVPHKSVNCCARAGIFSITKYVYHEQIYLEMALFNI